MSTNYTRSDLATLAVIARAHDMIPRRAAKIDANQGDVVKAFKQFGAQVCIIGKPVDLLICYQKKNVLIEVKDGKKPPSAQKLTADQVRFFDEWKGPLFIVRSIDDALDVLKKIQEDA